mgnify:CR=1 FL=1
MPVAIKKSRKDISAVFTRVKNKLALVLADSSQIHHVGSTAVPSLDGKNILDILISAKDSEHMSELRDKLVAIGYFPSLNPSSCQDYTFLASRQEETGEGDIHIHLAVADTETHDNFLIIRDYLRSRNDEADQYSSIKYQYAKQANYDRSAYKKLRAAYVDKLLQRARRWKNGG